MVAQTGLGHTWWCASTGPRFEAGLGSLLLCLVACESSLLSCIRGCRNLSVKDPLGHGDAFN